MKKFLLPTQFITICFAINAQQAPFKTDNYKPPLAFTENKGQIADEDGKPRSDIYFIAESGGAKLFLGDNCLHYQWKRTINDNVDSCGPQFSSLAKLRSEYYRTDVRLLGATHPSDIIKQNKLQGYTNYYLPACPQGITGVASYNGLILKNVYPGIDWLFYINGEKEIEYDFLVQPGGNPSDIAMQVDGASAVSIDVDGSVIITSPLGTCRQKTPIAWQDGKPLYSKFVLEGNILRLEVENYNPLLALRIDPVMQIFGTYYGGSGDETTTDVKVDNSGNIYLAGYTTSTSNISSGGFEANPGGGTDGFLAKFNTAGNLVWATYYGGDSTDYVYGCCTDASGNIFISGTTWSDNVIAYNGFKNSITQFPGTAYGCNAFLAKFNSAGARQWGTYVGTIQAVFNTNTLSWDSSNATDLGFGCATDGAGNVYLCGVEPGVTHTCTNQFGTTIACQNTYIATPGSYQDTSALNYYTPFIVAFNSNCQRLWGTYYGGSTQFLNLGDDVPHCSADNLGNAYLAGSIDNTYHGPSLGINGFQDTVGGGTDGWVAQFKSANGAFSWSTYYGGYDDEHLSGICTDSAGDVFITGNTTTSNLSQNNTIASPGAFMYDIPEVGTPAVFLAKFNSAGARQWGTYYGDVAPMYGGEVAADNSGRVTLALRGQFVSADDVGEIGYCGATHSPTYGIGITRFLSNGQRDWGETYSERLSTFYYPVSCAMSPNGKYTCLADWYNQIDTYNPPAMLNAYQSTINGGNDAFLLCYTDTNVYDTLSGYVFDDQNGNGVQDAGEGYLLNIELYVYVHGNTYTAYTNAGGFYQLIIPKWGYSGSCIGSLYLNRPYDKAISMPLSGYYLPSVFLPGGSCCYNFGLAPALIVEGEVYYDTNHDGALDGGEPGIPWQSVSFNAQHQTFTYDDGTYTVIIPVGTYTETFDKLDAYASSTSNPANYPISSMIGGTIFSNENFGAYFTPSFTNSGVEIIQSGGIPPVVGWHCNWSVEVDNEGTIPSQDTIVFHYDSNLVFLAATDVYVQNTVAHTLTFVTNQVVPARYWLSTLTFLVPVNVAVGTILHNWVTVNPTQQPDIDTTNNRADDYSVVLASYDPNDKTASTNTSNPSQQIARLWSNGNDYIRYVVDFQNTGTYTAHNVVINDTLSPNLDETTVKILASGSPCVINRNGHVLNFIFSGINLPDSSVSDSASRGYVAYEVKTSATAYPGDSILNHAAIYFDYNTAVLTPNNVVNLISNGPCIDTLKINLYDTVCALYHYTFGGQNITQAGTYTSPVYTGAHGCDSIAILHLTVTGQIETIGEYETVCSPNYVFNGHTYTTSGTYYGDTIVPPTGCPVDTVLHLTFTVQSYISYDTIGHCSAIILNDTLIIEKPVVVTDTSVYNNCIRVTTFYFIAPVTHAHLYLCNGDSLFVANAWRHTGGVFLDTLQSLCRQDSVVEYTLVDSSSSRLHSFVYGYFCQGGSYDFYGRILTQPGLYYDTLQAAGCNFDSIITLDLQQAYSAGYSYVDTFVNYGQQLYYHGQNYTAGNYTITLPGMCGFDSTVYLYVYQADTTNIYAYITVNQYPRCENNRMGSITINAEGGIPPYQYLWNTGATTATITGPEREYAVTVTDNVGHTAWQFIDLVSDTSFLVNAPDGNEVIYLCSTSDTDSYTITIDTPPGGGNYPYKIDFLQAGYVVTDSVYLNYPQASYTVNNITLNGGSVWFKVYDSRGCMNTNLFQSVVGPVNFIEPEHTVITAIPEVLSNGACATSSVQLQVASSDYYDSLGHVAGGSYYSSPPFYVSYTSNGIQYTDTLYYLDNYDTLKNLSPGMHTITITESSMAHCQQTLDINITGISVALALEQAGGCTASDTLKAMVQNGHAPFTYLWSNASVQDSIIVNQSGTYSVTVSDSAGCSVSSSQIVAISSGITAGITGTATGCGSVTLTATGGSHYTWSGGSSPVSATDTFTNSNTYTVTVTNNSGCSATASQAVRVNSIPSASVSPNGPTAFCYGDSVMLSANTESSYTWNSAAGGATTQSVTVKQSGNYAVTVTDANQCTAAAAAIVTVYNLPSAPVISQSHDTLSSSVAATYQWYLNDTLLINDTARILVINHTGTYSVQVTDSNLCANISAGLNVTTLAIADVADDNGVQIFPNPNNGNFTVQFSDNLPRTVLLTDVTGRLISVQQVSGRKDFDCTALSSGVYLLQIKADGESRTIRVVVAK